MLAYTEQQLAADGLPRVRPWGLVIPTYTVAEHPPPLTHCRYEDVDDRVEINVSLATLNIHRRVDPDNADGAPPSYAGRDGYFQKLFEDQGLHVIGLKEAYSVEQGCINGDQYVRGRCIRKGPVQLDLFAPTV